MPRYTRHTIVNRVRALHGKGEPLNITAVKRNHPKLLDAAFTMKPFLGWKQAVGAAGIRYSRVCVSLQQIVSCRLCDWEGESLISHLTRHHHVPPSDYLIDYPDAELTSETCRARIMGRHRPTGKKTKRLFPHWGPLWTPEYVLDRVFEAQRRGLPIHHVAVFHREPSLTRQAEKLFPLR